jgi:hypothetical protein
MPSCGGAVAFASDQGAVVRDQWTQTADAEEIVLRTVGRRETKDDILAKRLA